FMMALRRQIKPLRRVLIETTGLASPAPILFTLRHEPFLAERYVHAGTLAVVDASHIARQLLDQPEAAQQVALADLVVCAKPDLVDQDALSHALDAVAQVHPGVAMCVQWPDAALDRRLAPGEPLPLRVAGGSWGVGLAGLAGMSGGVRSPPGRVGGIVLSAGLIPPPFLTWHAAAQHVLSPWFVA